MVDDDPAIARLALQMIRTHGFGEGVHVATGREALDAVAEADIVLLDYNLPDTNGLDLLDAIRARPHPPSVILVTAHGNESFAAEALRRGADDYLAKDASLPDLLPYVLERVRRNRELQKALEAADRDRVRAERLAAMGELTVTLHHGINNPLMAASAAIELLLADPAMPEDQRRKLLDEGHASLRRIRDIVRQVGDLRSARTTSYLPGVRMVELGAAHPAAAATSRARAPVRHRGGSGPDRDPPPPRCRIHRRAPDHRRRPGAALDPAGARAGAGAGRFRGGRGASARGVRSPGRAGLPRRGAGGG